DLPIPSSGNKEKFLDKISGAGYNINHMIGAGIFRNPGFIWFLIKSPGIALILWVVGGIVSLFGSLVYIELGIRAFPRGIGEQIYIDDAFKRNLGHIFSFVAIFAIFPGSIIADSFTSARYLLYAIQGNSYDDNKIILAIVTIIMLAIVMAYQILSNKLFVYINQALALIKIMGLLIISIVGLVNLSNAGNWKTIFDKPSPDFGDYSEAMIKILFAYEDFLTNTAFITVVDHDYYVNMTNFKESFDNAIALRFVGNNDLQKSFMSAFVAISAFGRVGSMFFAYARIIAYAEQTRFMPKISNTFNRWHTKF
ncbi:25004_t:CDS:2, partial [Cetraspora pellucida]